MYFSSGKCQIAHWRQGHKEECHPPSTTHQTDDLVSNIGKKVAEPDYRGINERVESLAEENITGSNSESSDDSSVCESIISNKHGRSEGYICTDHMCDISDIKTNGNSIGATIPLSPKFASLVDDSVHGFSTMPKLNKEEIKLTSNVNPGLTMKKGDTTEPSKVPSGFWDCTLEKNMPNAGSESSENEDLHSSHCVDVSSIHSFHTVGSKVSNHVTINPGSTLRSAEISHLPQTSADTKFVSKAEDEHLHYNTKSMNNGTRNSSQAANCFPNSKDCLKTSVPKVADQFRGSNLSKQFSVSVGSDVVGKYSDKVIF